MAIFDYSIHVYVHVIICLAAIIYFLWVMDNHARARSFTIWFEIGFAMMFAFFVGIFVVFVTINQSVFSGLYIDPFLKFFKSLKLEDDLFRHSWAPSSFLYAAVLVPVLCGVLAVVFCTSTFHHIVCSRRPTKTDEWEDDIVRCVATLKRQLTFLSLVLVSSAVTSGTYVDLLPSLINPENKTVLAAYSELASTLSFASSMLFTVTLFAAFAPGVTFLLRDFAGLPIDKTGGFTAILERLNISKPINKVISIAQVVLTLAAPGLAAPLMDALFTTNG